MNFFGVKISLTVLHWNFFKSFTVWNFSISYGTTTQQKK